ncbi:hypothetical protein L1887_39080 [Cichorium endivia]|nr:hypothetical protein L1887_39074 [Cichorium endivia]KAI3496707.1 hypothetical protein L1887_39080 [Cichorium endivia]
MLEGIGGLPRSCEVNDANFDPATWWGTFGVSTPHLTKIAMRILSLTSSSSGCERNWSSFEGIHTKKRNRLDATKLNDLVYVQFNANLMEKNKKRKDRDTEVLLASESHTAQEWIVNCDDCDEDGVDPESNEGPVGDAHGSDELGQTSRTRELLDEDFESGSEEEVYEDVEYESDGVRIMEECGDKE